MVCHEPISIPVVDIPPFAFSLSVKFVEPPTSKFLFILTSSHNFTFLVPPAELLPTIINDLAPPLSDTI